MKNGWFVKSTWLDLLINYIPEPIKTMGGVQDKTMSLFKTNSTKNDCKSAHVKNVHDDGKKPRNLKLKALSEH